MKAEHVCLMMITNSCNCCTLHSLSLCQYPCYVCILVSAPAVFWVSRRLGTTVVVFQVRGTITTLCFFCSPSCWWAAGYSTDVSHVSKPTVHHYTITVSNIVLHLHWIRVLCLLFQTGRLTVWCIMRSKACGAWSLPWSAALPGCSVSSCWPFTTPAGPAWPCCYSSTRWLFAVC